ncbi:MAG: DUF4493 domain-containing protein [Duncaniella sp.]|nr:DUF4493 domain-containing protein [Duncaniella sp.]
MKTKILSLFLSVAACVGLASCHDDNWNPGYDSDTEGAVSLASMTVDVDDDEALVSRAGVSTDAFIVEVLDKKSGAVKRSYTYGSMPEVVSLAEGDYTVSVRSHNVKEAEWDAPYYVGQADFSIEVGKITEIGTVTCKFSNIKVTVKYTKELASYMGDDAKVRVIANDHGELDYSATETRAGYFAAVDGSTTLVAEFSATVKGNAVNALKTFTDVKAGQHYIITFSVKNGSATLPDEFGSIEASGIRIDAEMEHETVGGNAPAGDDNQQGTTQRPGDEEWPDEPVTPGPGPDQPGPDDPAEGTITITPDKKCEDLNLDGGNNKVVDGAFYIVNIHADNGIEHLRVEIASDNSDFMASLDEVGVPTDFDLAELSKEDYENLSSIGLPGNSDVKGKTDVPFDISELVKLLVAFEGEHTFTLTVTDGTTTVTKKLILNV